jgi:hypothetical protein
MCVAYSVLPGFQATRPTIGIASIAASKIKAVAHSSQVHSMNALKHKTRFASLFLQLRHPYPTIPQSALCSNMSQKTDSELLRLAPELVENVIKQVSDRRDLSKIRLTCKTLDKLAANELFKDVFVSPLAEHVTSWNSISQDDAVRQIPRHAIIHTQPDIELKGLGDAVERYEGEEGDEDYEGEEDDDEYPKFNNAIVALSKFPNLTSVEIAFTPECVGQDREYYQDVAEDVSQREGMLKRIFQAIKNRAADKKNRTIRKLTIVHLQNCPIPEFTSSDLFQDVMSQLEELHISMVQECNEHGPDHDYTKVELQTFPEYLCSHWLKPISTNLKALSIYHATENWGPFPGFFDPSGNSFPNLERLALGYYTSAHDSDLDWIFTIKSLRKLILHNCMIGSWLRIDKNNIAEWNLRTHDWTDMPDKHADADSWCRCFAYDGKWSQRFDRIAKELPNLVDFRFGSGSVYGDHSYGVEYRDTCGVGISPQRYVCFDNGILPTHWPEAEDDGDMHSWLDDGFPVNKHEENLEADQKSLDALLETLKSRA